MDPLTIGLIFLSATFHSIWNFLAKRSQNKYVFSWWMKIIELIIYLPISFYLLISCKFVASGWFIVILSGIVHFVYWMLLSSSYTYSDLSVVYPIARSAPLFVAFFGVLFFGEQLSYMGVIGILCSMIGIYILTMGSVRGHSFRLFRNKGVVFAFLTTLSVTAYSLIDKQGAQYFHPILFVWLENAISLIPLTSIIVYSKRVQISQEWDQNKWSIIASGFLGLLSYSLIVFVMQTFQVSYIVSIRQVSIVFGVILGGTFLQEKYLKTRLFSSILIFLGLFFISMS